MKAISITIEERLSFGAMGLFEPIPRLRGMTYYPPTRGFIRDNKSFNWLVVTGLAST